MHRSQAETDRKEAEVAVMAEREGHWCTKELGRDLEEQAGSDSVPVCPPVVSIFQQEPEIQIPTFRLVSQINHSSGHCFGTLDPPHNRVWNKEDSISAFLKQSRRSVNLTLSPCSLIHLLLSFLLPDSFPTPTPTSTHTLTSICKSLLICFVKVYLLSLARNICRYVLGSWYCHWLWFHGFSPLLFQSTE